MNAAAHLVPSASDRENASAGAEGNAVCGQPGASRQLLSMPNGLWPGGLSQQHHTCRWGCRGIQLMSTDEQQKPRRSYLKL